MASLIEGYEYDIFISYRQKDNKGDGWVTEFVNHLKREIEATFKEDVSVYFDENPYDGLLETHDVDASLKEKLRCLVFIPIVSRTYCDPKSFAWEHELKAFVELASKDRFGLKVKLAGGNVASRVLPVRIHELDIEDLSLCKSILGGVLRGVEFIYKEPGVNRPLTIDDDENKNLNRTKFRNQINKLANAIDEVIRGQKRVLAAAQEEEYKNEGYPLDDIKIRVKRSSVSQLSGSSESDTSIPYFKKLIKKKGLIYTAGSFFIVFVAVILFLFSSGSMLPFAERDWIVVADFKNHTGDTVFDRSLYTAFTLSVSQSRYINVLPRSRMIETLSRMEISDMMFIDDKAGREIATREGIGIYVVPGIGEVGNSYLITAEIMETKTGNLLKSVVVNAQTKNGVLEKLDKLSKRIRRDLGESRFGIASQSKPLAKVTTSSLEALKQYSLGIEHNKNGDFADARNYYENALLIDPDFTAAKASLGNLHIERFDPLTGRELLDQAVQSADDLTDREKYGIMAFHAVNVENDVARGIEYTRILTMLYPDDPGYRNNLGWYYLRSGQSEESLKEYKTAVRINPKLSIAYSGLIRLYLESFGRADSALVWSEKMIADNPQDKWGYINLGNAYLCYDSIAEAEYAFRQAREIDPNWVLNLYNLAHACRIQGKYSEAIRILDSVLEIDQDEHSAWYDLGVNFQSMGNQEEAGNHFSRFKKIVWEEWMNKWPDDAGTYTAAGSITARLGENETSEQMLQRALEIDSTSYYRLAGLLCLQGKVPEALDHLEKALENGYRNLLMLKMNPDLQILQNDIRFHNLINKYFW